MKCLPTLICVKGQRSSVWLILMKRAYTAYEYLKELGGDLGDTFAHGIPIGLLVT